MKLLLTKINQFMQRVVVLHASSLILFFDPFAVFGFFQQNYKAFYIALKVYSYPKSQNGIILDVSI